MQWPASGGDGLAPRLTETFLMEDWLDSLGNARYNAVREQTLLAVPRLICYQNSCLGVSFRNFFCF